MLKDCRLSNMISKREGTYIRKKDQEKHKVKLEKLDQQDKKEQQICQSGCIFQLKFKVLFIKEISKTLYINFQTNSYIISYKYRSEYLDKKIINTF